MKDFAQRLRIFLAKHGDKSLLGDVSDMLAVAYERARHFDSDDGDTWYNRDQFIMTAAVAVENACLTRVLADISRDDYPPFERVARAFVATGCKFIKFHKIEGAESGGSQTRTYITQAIDLGTNKEESARAIDEAIARLNAYAEEEGLRG